MRRIDASPDELGSVASHLRQQSLSALIDESDIAKIHHRLSVDATLTMAFPAPA
jgi:hypothetical protein